MKRRVLDIKKDILRTLRIEGEISLKALEIKVHTGSQTILTQLEELKFFGAIEVDRIKKNPRTGRASTSVKLTECGKKLI